MVNAEASVLARRPYPQDIAAAAAVPGLCPTDIIDSPEARWARWALAGDGQPRLWHNRVAGLLTITVLVALVVLSLMYASPLP